MLDLGLTRAQLRDYRETLTRSHEIRVTCMLLTPEHDVRRTITERLLEGQVDTVTPKRNGDDIEISRTASLRFSDPRQRLDLDDRTPSDAAFYLNTMMRIVYGVRCGFGWVNVPVFTGPITDVDRDGDEISVECQGKEVWALGSAWETGSEKGTIDEVTANLLRRAGEAGRYMDFPSSRRKTKVTIGRATKLWVKAWKIQSKDGRVLFYDARGRVRSRYKPTKPAITLRDGTGGLVMASPQVAYSVVDGLINAVRVVGRKPSKGKRGRPVGVAVAPGSHPLSPHRLGRFGKSLWLAEFRETDYKKSSSCSALARRILRESLLSHVKVTVETLPIPDLEPWDVFHLGTQEVSVNARVESMTLPLVQDGPEIETMTIGTTKKVRTRNRTRRRPRRR